MSYRNHPRTGSVRGKWGNGEREISGLPALIITLTKIVTTTSSAKLALAFGTVAASHRAVADYLISPYPHEDRRDISFG